MCRIPPWPANPPAMLDDRHAESRYPLAGDVDDVFGVVEKGDGVMIAAEQQDLAAEREKPFEGRPVAEGVVPGWLEIRCAACLPHTTNRATCALTIDPG